MPRVTQLISASCSGLGCFAGSCRLCLRDLSSLSSKAEPSHKRQRPELRLEMWGDPVFSFRLPEISDIRAGGQGEVISDVCAGTARVARRSARIPGVHAGRIRDPPRPSSFFSRQPPALAE